jgi:hypothetical protein
MVANDESEQASPIEPPEACLCMYLRRLRESFPPTRFVGETHASTVGSGKGPLMDVADMVIVKPKEKSLIKPGIEAEHLQAHPKAGLHP